MNINFVDLIHKHLNLNSKICVPSFTIKDSQMLWQNTTIMFNQTNWTKINLG